MKDISLWSRSTSRAAAELACRLARAHTRLQKPPAVSGSTRGISQQGTPGCKLQWRCVCRRQQPAVLDTSSTSLRQLHTCSATKPPPQLHRQRRLTPPGCLRRPWQAHRPAKHRHRLAAAEDGFGESPVDIDELARQLGQEAERLRQAQAASRAAGAPPDPILEPLAEELLNSAQQVANAREASAPFGYESKAAEAEVLAEVGDGGFCPGDFEIVQQLGRLSVQQVMTDMFGGNPLQGGRGEGREQTAVIAFLARYYTGMPYEDPVTVFLKEFLPGTKAVACNELQTMTQLCGLPRHKWRAASEPLSADLPIVPLLGYFLGAQSDVAATLSGDADSSAAAGGEEDETLWLVYKWEGLQPLSAYLPAPQQAPTFFWAQTGAETRNRCNMLRALARGALEALAFCHEHSVAHGSLGAGSLLLSHLDDRRAQQLVVKLDNFGFARRVRLDTAQEVSRLYPRPAPLHEDHPLLVAQREDLRALGLVLLDTVFGALAAEGLACRTPIEAVQRLALDVFAGDLLEFRRYCKQEPDWADAVAFLEEHDQAGWTLLQHLVTGDRSAMQLAVDPFLTFAS